METILKFKPKLIIFDFDGVLVDTHKDIALAANHILQGLGIAQIPTSTIKGYIGNGPVVLMQRCLPDWDEAKVKELAREFDQYYKENYMVESSLYPGVTEVLEQLHQRDKVMAIATQKPGPVTSSILEKLQVPAYFSSIVGSDSITHRKPHPESILRILEQTKQTAEQAIMIGDVPSDIMAGKSAGTLTCAVEYGYGKLQEIKEVKPDLIIGQIEQLLDRIE